MKATLRRPGRLPIDGREKMALVPPLAHLVREATSGDDLDLELAAPGSDDPDEIATLLSDFLSVRLAPIGDALFYRRGTVKGAQTHLLHIRQAACRRRSLWVNLMGSVPNRRELLAGSRRRG